MATNSPVPRLNLTKVPGELPKSKPDRYVDDLSKLTKNQLLEIKEREEKLISNRLRISKLPDKGKRIQDFYKKILKEIEHRDEVEKAAVLFSDLNIASTGQNKLNNMEWNGRYDSSVGDLVVDSDDDEEVDPLKIIAGAMSKRKVKILKPEKPLITEEDLKEIESFEKENQDEQNYDAKSIVNAEIINVDVTEKLSIIKPRLEKKLNESLSSSTNSLNLEPHVLYLFGKDFNNSPQKEKFKPYKTTKSNVHDPEKEKLRKPLGKYWEVTAATPPPIQNTGTQMLHLQDSVELQMQYLERLKKLQEKQAEERLAARMTRKSELGNIIIPDDSMIKLSKFFGNYRLVGMDEHSSDEEQDHEHEKIFSDDEVRDNEDKKNEGGVIYTVYT